MKLKVLPEENVVAWEEFLGSISVVSSFLSLYPESTLG